MLVGTGGAESRGSMGVHGGKGYGRYGRISQGKRWTHKENRDETTLNNIGSEFNSLLVSTLGK